MNSRIGIRRPLHQGGASREGTHHFPGMGRCLCMGNSTKLSDQCSVAAVKIACHLIRGTRDSWGKWAASGVKDLEADIPVP